MKYNILGKIAKPLTNDEAIELYRQIRKDPTNPILKQQMIEGHMHDGMVIATGFAKKKAPYLFFEIISEMLFALTKGTQQMALGRLESHGANPNPTGFLRVWVQRSIVRYLRTNRILHRKVVFSSDFNRHQARETGTNELVEIISKLPLTETKRKILELRAQSKTYDEIGEEIGITKARVEQVIREIRERVLEKIR